MSPSIKEKEKYLMSNFTLMNNKIKSQSDQITKLLESVSYNDLILNKF